jgi:hypothetical protein
MKKSFLTVAAVIAAASAHFETPNANDIRSGVSEAQRIAERAIGPRHLKLSP